jgi:hypothetical protein
MVNLKAQASTMLAPNQITAVTNNRTDVLVQSGISFAYREVANRTADVEVNLTAKDMEKIVVRMNSARKGLHTHDVAKVLEGLSSADVLLFRLVMEQGIQNPTTSEKLKALETHLEEARDSIKLNDQNKTYNELNSADSILF